MFVKEYNYPKDLIKDNFKKRYIPSKRKAYLNKKLSMLPVIEE